MTLRFSVLASGSSGNASFVEAGGCGVLIDAGLGPRQLASRLATIDRGWNNISAVVLTHTHSDHWNDRTFACLLRHRIPLFCHADHHISLRLASSFFSQLRTAQLVHGYEPGQFLQIRQTLSFAALPLRHDETTCGFRFEAQTGNDGRKAALGYAADLGCWDEALADAFEDVDILALEFNHDVFLERSSGRPAELIYRVLGDKGHLSNGQAANLLREVLKRSGPGRPQHLVQLHLSRQCNRPAMAVDAARVILKEMKAEVEIHTAQQFCAGPSLTVRHHGEGLTSQGALKVGAGQQQHVQSVFPGWEAD